MPDNKTAAPTGIGNGRTDQQRTASIAQVPTARKKWQRVLAALLDRPHTTRELERAPVFDHVGHSTASELRKMGLSIHTEMIEIPGYQGLPARVARYTLLPESREHAARLLGGES